MRCVHAQAQQSVHVWLYMNIEDIVLAGITTKQTTVIARIRLVSVDDIEKETLMVRMWSAASVKTRLAVSLA